MKHFVLGSDSKSGRRCEGLAACWSCCRWQQAAPPASGRQASSCCALRNWRESGWHVGAEGEKCHPTGTGAGWTLPRPRPGLKLMWVTPPTPPQACHDFPAVIPRLSPPWAPALSRVPELNSRLQPKLPFLPTPDPHPDFPFFLPGPESQSCLSASLIDLGAVSKAFRFPHLHVPLPFLSVLSSS